MTEPKRTVRENAQKERKELGEFLDPDSESDTDPGANFVNSDTDPGTKYCKKKLWVRVGRTDEYFLVFFKKGLKRTVRKGR